MGDFAPPEAPAALPRGPARATSWPRGRRRRPGRAGSAVAAWLLSLAAVAVAPALAAPAQPAAADPELEARVLKLAAELRCLVCQNQTIADSNAGLAQDLRNQVRDMLRQGRSEREVLDYMTARYGDFVLYRPPMKESTALLWLGPGLLFAGGLLVLVFVLRRRARAGDDAFEPDPGVDEDDEGQGGAGAQQRKAT
ncbi:MAG: cytochrome c-type biogenesis protein CcmH [Rubrivivax sp.]|nr:cytochrome c-type biogenesis protein CcmH [Rubrivivax sp.]